MSTALVLGGGFAGLEAAIQLTRRGVGVTLISNRPYLFVYPTSIWIPTGESTFEDSCLDLADVATRRGFTFRQGEVQHIDGALHTVRVDGEALTADHLVLAFGGLRTRLPGMEHTHTLGGDPHATERFREALSALMEKGEGKIALGFGGNPKDPSAVRGGPVFEMLFNIDTLLRRRKLRDKFELTFFAPMPKPGKRMGEAALAVLEQMLADKNIPARTGVKITRFSEDAVHFEQGDPLDSDLTVYLPAGAGNPLAAGLPVNEGGFVSIEPTCEVKGIPGVWAIGDVAALEGPEWRAKQGHLAEVMARVAAENIQAMDEGKPKSASYIDHMSIICLMDTGDGAAYVYRDDHKSRLIPMPVFGHWAKKGWGVYFKASKRGTVPTLPI